MSKNLKFKELQIRNFLSFGNNTTVIDLTDEGSTLIVGKNLDSGSNNGAGKCVSSDTTINIRNKHTGEIKTLTVGDFYERLKKSGRKD
jgi:hypothetical protein